MTIEELLEKYKKKYPGVPYEVPSKTDVKIVSKKNGKEHSYGDAPSIVYTDEAKHWHKKGKRHRENDKPAIIIPNGIKKWYKEGELHRENDKPAIIWANGEKEYWYNGKEYDLIPPEIQKKRIEKLTPKKSSKQKRREDLLKEFVCEVLST